MIRPKAYANVIINCKCYNKFNNLSVQIIMNLHDY